jgi:hypothetical protein
MRERCHDTRELIAHFGMCCVEVCAPLVCKPNRSTMNVCEKLHRCATAPSPTLRGHSQAITIIRVSLIRLIEHHLFLQPLCPQRFCSSSHPISRGPLWRVSGVASTPMAQLKIFEVREDWGIVSGSRKDTAADADEEANQGVRGWLGVRVVFQLLPCMPALPSHSGESPFLAHRGQSGKLHRPLGATRYPAASKRSRTRARKRNPVCLRGPLSRIQCMWVTSVCNEPPSQVSDWRCVSGSSECTTHS